MRIYSNFPTEPPDRPEYPVVTVGVFDGLHRGHAHLIETALASAAGRPVALVTFDPHPRAVLGPPKHHRLLTPIAERLDHLRRWPLAAVAVLRFDATVAQQTYAQFVRGSLVELLGARLIVLGYNLRLGHQRQGTTERIAELGREVGFEVSVVAPFELDGVPVSSTRIRDLLDAGEVREAGVLLGRAYELRGKVVPGAGRGRGLGFPTANLQMPAEKLVPSSGVYAARASVGGRRYPVALSIGSAPTFGEAAAPSVEAHLVDFDGDLYGAELRVELVERLRAQQRFATPAALASEIARDVERVRALVEAG